MALERLKPGLWRRVKDAVHDLQAGAARLSGQPNGGMRTDLRRGSQPVIFIHNPKSGGTSLGRFLHVGRRSHSFPVDVLSEKSWIDNYSIVVVREPFERFMSCYFGNVMRPQDNGLTKRYGRGIKSLSPIEFLDIIRENPKYGGPQTLWTDYPCPAKPRADLILRFEDVADWKPLLLAAGLPVQDRDIEHQNKSARSETPGEVLGLSATDLAALRSAVADHYRGDYAAFGYAPANPDPANSSN